MEKENASTSKRPLLAPTAKVARKRKSAEEKAETKRRCELHRNGRRVNIGDSFERWRRLRQDLGLKTDAETADFLLNSYERSPVASTPVKAGPRRPPAPAASMFLSASLSDRYDRYSSSSKRRKPGLTRLLPAMSEAPSDRDKHMEELDTSAQENAVPEMEVILDWDDDTWHPDQKTESESEEEEEEDQTGEVDYDDSDEDYMPCISVGTGGALNTQISLDSLPSVSMEDSVHDAVHHSENTTTADTPSFPGTAKVLVEDDVIGQPASITYNDCLKQLVDYLVLPINMCTAMDPNTKAVCSAPRPFEVHIKSKGTAAIIDWMCPHGHAVWRWSSQPSLQHGMLVGDFMMATNILLSGNNYAKIALLFKFMNMGMVERSVFLRIQDSYCVDSIQEFWDEKRGQVVTQLHSKGPVVILGDARMDSPGFCAQYCTYTAMDNESKQIISMVNIDQQETQRNPVVMETEGFVRTFETLRKELNVTEICTDAHTQISALFSEGDYKDCGVHHSLDIWHGSKNLSKKMMAAAQQKGCSVLQAWNKDICDHFLFCCETAETYEEFLNMWIGLLHHVVGEHAWALGACQHGPLGESREKEWMQQGGVAHQRLTEIILDARWLKTVHKYLRFRSTADLESFHNHILMYASSGFSFSPPVYTARTMLAGLDYNHHVHRQARRNADGSIQNGRLFNNKSRTWRLYTLKVDKDYTYITDLQSAILRRASSATTGTPRTGQVRPDDPHQHGVLSGVPPPNTQDMKDKQVSRGLGQLLPKD